MPALRLRSTPTRFLLNSKKQIRLKSTGLITLILFLKELANFIKKYHTTGLTWNPKGGNAASSQPTPVSKPPTSSTPTHAPKTSGNVNLFAELSKGTEITSGLKKVTKDMKTSARTDKSSVVPAIEVKETKKPATAAAAKKGTPKMELVGGTKWLVEWQDGATIDISETEPKQTVYLYKCEKTTVKVSGKINTILVDGCKRVGVVFEQVVSGCELVNSNSVEIQVTGKIPSIAIDKCSGVQLYLSKDSLAVEIVTSKSDQMNVLIPDPAGGLDPIEIAIPEQFKTTIKDNKLFTSTVEHV